MGIPAQSDPRFPPEINGPAAGDDRGPFLLLAHGLGISGPAPPGRRGWDWRVVERRVVAGTGVPADPGRSVAAPAG